MKINVLGIHQNNYSDTDFHISGTVHSAIINCMELFGFGINDFHKDVQIVFWAYELFLHKECFSMERFVYETKMTDSVVGNVIKSLKRIGAEDTEKAFVELTEYCKNNLSGFNKFLVEMEKDPNSYISFEGEFSNKFPYVPVNEIQVKLNSYVIKCNHIVAMPDEQYHSYWNELGKNILHESDILRRGIDYNSCKVEGGEFDLIIKRFKIDCNFNIVDVVEIIPSNMTAKLIGDGKLYFFSVENNMVEIKDDSGAIVFKRGLLVLDDFFSPLNPNKYL